MLPGSVAKHQPGWTAFRPARHYNPEARPVGQGGHVNRKPAKRTTKAAPAAGDQAFTKVLAAFARDASVTTGGKFGSTSLMRNGKVFAMWMKGRFVAKLPAERVDQLRTEGVGENLVMGKRTMKEWVAIEGERALWPGLAREAYRCVKPAKG
jgi:hypothetical protein